MQLEKAHAATKTRCSKKEKSQGSHQSTWTSWPLGSGQGQPQNNRILAEPGRPWHVHTSAPTTAIGAQLSPQGTQKCLTFPCHPGNGGGNGQEEGRSFCSHPSQRLFLAPAPTQPQSKCKSSPRKEKEIPLRATCSTVGGAQLSQQPHLTPSASTIRQTWV